MAVAFISPELYAYGILPLLIFLSRVADVSMETIRVIYISRGIKYLAPIIAFFEIIIWLLAMEVVLSDLANWINFFAYAFGFATGTYVGLVLEEKLSIGMVILRIITTETDAHEGIAAFLAREQFGVTNIDACGSRGDVRIILTLINRTDLARITGYLRENYPRTFFSIEDVRYANEGVFRPKKGHSLIGIAGLLNPWNTKK
ncbi:MAG: DUF2179 domain-containing protein [Methanomicrobiales archaeon]|nr:DUF2179 domain-containing protein [Methanomicrobiales archaeon]